MVDDIFDTRFENKDIEIDDNFVELGEDINISAKDPTMRRITIGMGWDVNAFDGTAVDLDVSLFMLDKNNMTREDGDFVFYNNLKAYNGGILHNGDSRTGAGDGDDESIDLFLEMIPFDILRIAVVLTVYKGYEREHNLGMVRNAYVRIVNAETRQEILRFNLNDLLKDHQETGVTVAYLNREGPKWHFVAAADFIKGGLPEIATQYGLVIGQQ